MHMEFLICHANSCGHHVLTYIRVWATETTATTTITTAATAIAFGSTMTLITVHCADESEEFIGNLHYLQEKSNR